MRIEKVNTAEFRDEALQEMSYHLEKEIRFISRKIANGVNGIMPTRMLGDILLVNSSSVLILSNYSRSCLKKMERIEVTVKSMSSSDRWVCKSFNEYYNHIVRSSFKDYGNDYLLVAGALFNEVMQFIAGDARYLSLSVRYYIVMLYMPVIWNALREYMKVISN